MRRVVWFSLGVAVTVVVVVRGRRLLVRYMPASLADRAARTVISSGEQAWRFAEEFRSEFTRAFDERERTLLAALLDERPTPTPAAHDREIWEDDDDELGYSF